MRIVFIKILVMLSIMLVGCGGSDKTDNGFTEDQAINKVLEIHPEFPRDPKKIVTEEIGFRFVREFRTTISKIGTDAYIITLAINHDFVIDGEIVVDYLIYKVTPDSVRLVYAENNTTLMDSIR